MKILNPQALKGKLFVDQRGKLGFVNDFKFTGIKRFYIISGCKTGEFRGWHGHKKEEKYAFVVSGKVDLYLIKIQDWKKKDSLFKEYKFELSEDSPKIIHIPKGFANGFITRTRDASIIFYSNLSLTQSKRDDIRFPENFWKHE